MIRSPRSDIRTSCPSVEASAEPICTIGPSRPTDPPAADADRRGECLDDRHLRAYPPAVLGDREHHLGHPVAARLAGVALDQRPVEQPADHRDTSTEADTEPRQVQARRVALLPELLVPGHQPRDGKTSSRKPTAPSPAPTPTSSAITTSPSREPPSQRRYCAPSPHWPQPSDQSCSGTSPAASANSRNAPSAEARSAASASAARSARSQRGDDLLTSATSSRARRRSARRAPRGGPR